MESNFYSIWYIRGPINWFVLSNTSLYRSLLYQAYAYVQNLQKKIGDLRLDRCTARSVLPEVRTIASLLYSLFLLPFNILSLPPMTYLLMSPLLSMYYV